MIKPDQCYKSLNIFWEKISNCVKEEPVEIEINIFLFIEHKCSIAAKTWINDVVPYKNWDVHVKLVWSTPNFAEFVF